jgi:hypothetical protein
VQLTDKTVSVALASGRQAFVMASLTHSLFNSGGGKTITALTWKAPLASAIRWDAIAPFPMTEDDMVWKTDLVEDVD